MSDSGDAAGTAREAAAKPVLDDAAGPDYFELARLGRLPRGFGRWSLAGPDGRTVAHAAAEAGNLPEGFSLWHLPDRRGRTVTHEAVESGHFPEGFGRWRLADAKGWSVARQGAESGHLPECFELWRLADNNDLLVSDVAKRRELENGREPGAGPIAG